MFWQHLILAKGCHFKPRFNKDCDNLDLVQMVQIVAGDNLDRATIWTVTGGGGCFVLWYMDSGGKIVAMISDKNKQNFD